MSSIPLTSAQQSIKNRTKLLSQNKHLHSQLVQFQQQINIILLTPPIITSTNNKPSISLHQLKDNPDYIQSQEQLIEINKLKAQLEYLKSINVKENVHYILQEEDELKIIKEHLLKVKREKKVQIDFIKDKRVKLQITNTQLSTHKDTLRQQLKQTIKQNRQSACQIVQTQRQIRKYHLARSLFKTLSNNPQSSITPQFSISQIDHELKQYQQQTKSIQDKWASQLESLDQEYFMLRQKLDRKRILVKQVQANQAFHQTRVLVMSDQQKILKDKERKSKLMPSPRLQQQLQQYLDQQRQRIQKKKQYTLRHSPKNPQQQQLIRKELLSSKLQQKQQIVQKVDDDKNITRIQNYLVKRQKDDKSIETKKYQIQSDRIQRTWTDHQTINKLRQSNKQQKHSTKRKTPRIILKNVQLGTTFYQDSNQLNLNNKSKI